MSSFGHEIDLNWIWYLLRSLRVHLKLSKNANFVSFACLLAHFLFLWSFLWSMPYLKCEMPILPILSQTFCHFCVNFLVRIFWLSPQWNLFVVHMSMLRWIFRIFGHRLLGQIAIDMSECPAALFCFWCNVLCSWIFTNSRVTYLRKLPSWKLFLIEYLTYCILLGPIIYWSNPNFSDLDCLIWCLLLWFFAAILF